MRKTRSLPKTFGGKKKKLKKRWREPEIKIWENKEIWQTNGEEEKVEVKTKGRRDQQRLQRGSKKWGGRRYETAEREIKFVFFESYNTRKPQEKFYNVRKKLCGQKEEEEERTRRTRRSRRRTKVRWERRIRKDSNEDEVARWNVKNLRISSRH